MTDTTLKLTEAFNRHNSLYNALLCGMKTMTTSNTEEITITLDARHARAYRHHSKDIHGQATPARGRNNRNGDPHNNPRRTLLPRLRAKPNGRRSRNALTPYAILET